MYQPKKNPESIERAPELMTAEQARKCARTHVRNVVIGNIKGAATFGFTRTTCHEALPEELIKELKESGYTVYLEANTAVGPVYTISWN